MTDPSIPPSPRPTAPEGTKGNGRGVWRLRRTKHAVTSHLPSTDAHLILHSGLFDPEWYAATAGCSPDPVTAANHYLEGGWKQGHTAHPLFDHRHLMKRYAEIIGDRNPLVAYLSDPRMRTASTQPLMAYRTYQRTHPEARRFSRGATRHYLEVGARKGFAPTTWYQPNPVDEPEGLADWMRQRRREWVERRRNATTTWTTDAPDEESSSSTAEAHQIAATVTVVLPAGANTDQLSAALASVQRQDLSPTEIVVVHDAAREEQLQDVRDAVAHDTRVRFLAVDSPDRSSALALGAGVAQGEWVAFCLPTAEWAEHHLSTVLGHAITEGLDAASDVVERVDSENRPRYARGPVTVERSVVTPQLHPAGLVVRRKAIEDAGGIDPSLRSAAMHDLELHLASRGTVDIVPTVGVRTSAAAEKAAADAVPLRVRPRLDLEQLATWHHVAVQRHLIDWDRLDAGDEGVVSVIIPTHADHDLTHRAVASIHAAQDVARSAWEEAGGEGPEPPAVEVVVLDNGCAADIAVALDSLPLEFPGTVVAHEPVNRGFSMGNNLALSHARGAVIVFLNNDTEVLPGWLEPLTAALDDPEVLGAQSLLIYPSGSIQSAGIAFPTTGGVPHPLLQGFPVEDARLVATLPFNACTAASLAMRRSDVVAGRGFDPLFLNGMEDVDLGLRMKDLRGGRFTVCPTSKVVHHESRAPGRFERSLVNRRLFLDRHAESVPRDDVSLWGAVGYDVTGHQVRHVVSADRRVSVPEPVLARRRPTAHVSEGLPSLRWALKNPAPPGPEAERWGDTHFIRRLGAALEALGQEVIIDHRPEFDRATGRFDDVVLVLRGVAPYTPIYGQVSLCWLISHPEMMSRREAQSYDRVFAASRTWSSQMSQEWGVRIDPLLQATDPELFHPDRGEPDTGHSLLFVGSSRKVLRPLVGAAVDQGLPLSVIGHQWDGLIPARYVKAEYLGNDLVGEAYRRAGVVLNDHWDDMREQGFISNRLFDAVASGSRVVTDHVAGIDGLFGRSVQVVDDPAELGKLVNAADLDAVFGSDDERRAAAAKVHAEHSFEARARTLVQTAAELGAGRWDVHRQQSDGVVG